MRMVQEVSIKDMSGLGVKLFFPALLIVNLGSQLHSGSALNYLPVLAWAVVYTVASIGMGHAITKLFKLPPWVTPAVAFNNTTSLPLLLLQSLKSAGSLKTIVPEDSTMADSIERAQSYFLVCAVVSKVIAYTTGPRMLQDIRGDGTDQDTGSDGQEEAGEHHDGHPSREQIDEETSLLPEPAQKARQKVGSRIKRVTDKIYSYFPEPVKQELVSFDSPFVDAAIFCALTGALLGLVPPLHKAFFNPYDEGGIFNAWLTSSIKNLGKLFTTLQVFVVGCKLGVSFERMKNTKNSGKVPFKGIVVIFLIRLVIWPAISIYVIYILASRTKFLMEDPILWFSMMLMPAGPPALIISGLAELAKATELERFAIAKAMTILYALSPLICFTITGALKASEAVLESKK
ncbi:hypothetical protein VTN00DRAFT_6532 [Thermoascus crustaceus]|uniref:uncharacterized protein n=1 Tax=Thermoascus crustaceus TaxID=5088 RepID=UPI0037439B54